MAQDYQAMITSYLQQGYIRKLPDNKMKEVPGWLLPHFPVFYPGRQTTKTQIVFDASAKHKGVSLNDEILPGPKLQNDLVDIPLWFRNPKPDSPCSRHQPDVLKNSNCFPGLPILPFSVEGLGYEKKT